MSKARFPNGMPLSTANQRIGENSKVGWKSYPTGNAGSPKCGIFTPTMMSSISDPKKTARKSIRQFTTDIGGWPLAFEYTNYRLCGNVGNRKKGGWFPLKQGSVASTFQCPCEESESYYLLDPTDPYDPELLAFDEEGKAIPSPNCQSEWEKQRAEETITRLKLTEHELFMVSSAVF